MKKQYYLNIARAVAKGSTCLRRQYGAVIVKNDRILGTGFNGAARGIEHCTDTGLCVREELKVPHGERYELCVAVHAEQNAVINAQCDVSGATLYLVGFEGGKEIKAEPCLMCARVIKNAEIAEVVTSAPAVKVCGNCKYAENVGLRDVMCVCDKSEYCANYVYDDDKCKFWEE